MSEFTPVKINIFFGPDVSGERRDINAKIIDHWSAVRSIYHQRDLSPERALKAMGLEQAVDLVDTIDDPQKSFAVTLQEIIHGADRWGLELSDILSIEGNSVNINFVGLLKSPEERLTAEQKALIAGTALDKFLRWTEPGQGIQLGFTREGNSINFNGSFDEQTLHELIESYKSSTRNFEEPEHSYALGFLCIAFAIIQNLNEGIDNF